MSDSFQFRFGSPLSVEFATMASIPNFTGTLADANGEGVGLFYRFDCTGTTDTITHIGYRKGSVTGTPAANSYEVMLCGVDSTGLPNLTDLGGGSPTLTTFTPSTTPNIWQWVALGNSYVMNRDEPFFAIVRANSSITASNNMSIISGANLTSIRAGVPYCVTNTGSWAKQPTYWGPLIAVKSANAVYGYPMLNISNDSYGSTTELGMWFNIPSNFCSTFKIVGVEADISGPATGANTHVCTLYSSPFGTPVIQAQSNITDVDYIATAATRRVVRWSFDDAYSLPSLSAGTDYVIGFATTAAAAGVLNSFTVDAADDWRAYSGDRQFAYTSRTLTSYPPDTDTGSFAAVTATRRPIVQLIISDLTAPVGGGGGLAANPVRGFVV